MEIVIAVLFVLVVVVAAILSARQARKRREAMGRLADSLGLQFSPDKDHAVDDRYPFLDKLGQGSNRYAFNSLSGQHQGQSVHLFDYHYETHSRDSKGRPQTHHHYFSFFILRLPAHFPELTIAREGIFSKLAQFVGYDDIDFESAEFSRKFCVRSRDKKFAYDICHPRMMEYLLANPDLNLEIEQDCLALFFPSRLALEQIAPNLERLLQIRQQFPEYLWKS
jgi:hypothetical protein